MKEIKVYLQKPWRTSDSAYYTYLKQDLPREIKFVNYKDKGVIHKKSSFVFNNFVKNFGRKVLRNVFPSMPNAHLTNLKQDYDLIHCGHCLSLNKYKPWVADIEHAGQFWISGMCDSEGNKKLVRNILLRKNCKKILAWTEWSKRSILEHFPEIKDKVEVVYPTVPLKVKKKSFNDKKLTVLYATRYFWLKGGIIALEVFKELKKRYGKRVDLVFISHVPKELRKKYPEINILGVVPQKKLFEYYKKADLFFYPSMSDTFGFGVLEAMSYGLPIINLKTFGTHSIQEIVENRKHGFIFEVEKKVAERIMENKEKLVLGKEEKEIINKLVKNCTALLEDKNLRKEVSSNCIKEIKSGKFSMKERNKKLKRIYKGALNKN